MRPILFHWQRLTIHSYTAMLYVGLVAGLVAGDAAAHAAGIDALRTYIASSILIVPALLGARVLYVAVHLGFNRQNLRRVWNRHEGGASQYGALVLALPFSVPLTSALRLPLGAFWDVATLTILVGMIFVRIGCLMHGCCAGRKSESWLGLYLPNHRGVWERRFPTQCLEAGWAAVLLTFAIVFWPRMPFPGSLFLVITAGYAAGRLVLESLREQSSDAGRFNFYHHFSLVLIVLSLATLTASWPR
jgi:phosphatidylglycerol:prolipoprotein diacylglycerol transferase